MDEMMMPGMAPDVNGTWYNTVTGDSFTVRDSYIEDGNFVVLATDGRRFDMDMLSQYIRSEVPIRQPQPNPGKIDVGALANDLDPDILNEIIQPGSEMPAYNPNGIGLEGTPGQNIGDGSVNFDQEMIRRVLKKAQLPEINFDISWEKFPQRQLEMLVDFMDVPIEDVCTYFANKLNIDSLKDAICEELAKMIKEKFEEQQ